MGGTHTRQRWIARRHNEVAIEAPHSLLRQDTDETFAVASYATAATAAVMFKVAPANRGQPPCPKPSVILPDGMFWKLEEEINLDVPDDNCMCGIYAVSEVTASMSVDDWGVVGTVSIWGRTRQAQRGVRGQYGYPRELWAHPRIAATVTEKYGVPVHTDRLFLGGQWVKATPALLGRIEFDHLSEEKAVEQRAKNKLKKKRRRRRWTRIFHS